MASKLEKPTKKQLSDAVDAMAEMFPEEASNLRKYRDTIVDCLLNNTEPEQRSALRTLKFTDSDQPQAVVLAAIPAVSPCVEAIGIVFVDVVFFALGLLGLHTSNQERVTRALLRELGEDTLRGFARAIRNFNEAEGAYEKSKALFAIVGGIWNAGGFRAVFKVIKDEMTWWEWVKTCVISLAQLTAWIATDGIAFIAEAALSIMSAEQLIEDAVKCVNACFSVS